MSVTESNKKREELRHCKASIFEPLLSQALKDVMNGYEHPSFEFVELVLTPNDPNIIEFIKNLRSVVMNEDGIIIQRNKKLITNIPPSYFKINSGIRTLESEKYLKAFLYILIYELWRTILHLSPVQAKSIKKNRLVLDRLKSDFMVVDEFVNPLIRLNSYYDFHPIILSSLKKCENHLNQSISDISFECFSKHLIVGELVAPILIRWEYRKNYKKNLSQRRYRSGLSKNNKV